MSRINARITALKDITKYMKEQNIQIQDNHGDVWIFTASKLETKEQRRLNKELGINKVNYTKKAMSRKTNK